MQVVQKVMDAQRRIYEGGRENPSRSPGKRSGQPTHVFGRTTGSSGSFQRPAGTR